jgi:hypothetical protein
VAPALSFLRRGVNRTGGRIGREPRAGQPDLALSMAAFANRDQRCAHCGVLAWRDDMPSSNRMRAERQRSPRRVMGLIQAGCVPLDCVCSGDDADRRQA